MVDPAPAEVRETHVSWVFLAGERAYKLLKPIRNDFLDQSTPELRGEAVRRELALNRRLAPDVYLGATPIIEGDRIADHLLVMRRLPDDRRLASLVGADEFGEQLRRVAKAVAVFHAALPADPAAAAVSTRDAVAARWEDNVTTMAPYVGPVLDAEVVDRVGDLFRRYLADRAPLFQQRIDAGWVRDGHGDLLAEDIFCLDDGPRILDCLAFDASLRYGDVLNDIAFLVMDVERLAGPWWAQRLLSWYQEFGAERHPGSLAHHYIAYRAHVRAKVACLRFGQGDHRAADRARADLDLAHRHLELARVRMVVVGGPPGSGKSTLAGNLGSALGWTVLSSDEVRKDVMGLGRGEHAYAKVGQGIYRPEATQIVYEELLRRADRLLERGESVVLDASWAGAPHRATARRLGWAHRAEVVEVRCELPVAVAKERVARRMASGFDPSDATPEVVEHLLAQFDPWPEARVAVTTDPPDRVADAVLATVT
jgi:aminoglycoside phosphotransferase family enzyme/predicted kinase